MGPPSHKAKSRRKTIGCVVVPVVLLATAVLAIYIYDRAVTHAAGIDATKNWARLDSIPSSASRITVTTRGGPFTREYTVTFHAPLSDINAWLDASAGTKGVLPKTSGAKRKYVIEPGGGAMYAEVEVDDGAETVKIRTYWS